jgi:hypothetical protein
LNTTNALRRLAVGVTVGAVSVLGLTSPAAAASSRASCVTTTLDRGWVTSTVRISNDCSYDINRRILMSAPRPGGYPCVTIPSGYTWSYKFAKAYHVYWGTQSC